MNPIEKARRIKQLVQMIADLTAEIAKADPTAGWRDAAGNWINRLTQLQSQLAAAEAELASLGGPAAGAAAGETSLVARAAQAASRTGRAIINVARAALGKPPLPPLAAGGAATALGVAVAVAVVAGATYGAARLAGSYSADDPIQAGAAMDRPVATSVGVPGANDAGKFAIFVLTQNSDGTIWIGDEQSLKSLRACDTPNGGLCDPDIEYPPVAYERKSQDFDTYEEALAEFCASTVQRPGYWGNKAEGYGGTFWSEYPCASQ